MPPPPGLAAAGAGRGPLPVKYLSQEWIDEYNAALAKDDAVHATLKGKSAALQMVQLRGPLDKIQNALATSVQWDAAAVRACAEFSASTTRGRPSALVEGCASLRDSIDAAVAAGRLEVSPP